MLKALILTRLQSIFSSTFRSSKLKRKKSIPLLIGVGLLALYVICAFLFLFGMLAFSLCNPLHSVGLDWFYFALMSGMAAVLMFVGSVFATQSQIYDAKDNELLLSMPIPPSYILASRIAALYLLNILYELMVLLPTYAVYVYVVGFSIGGTVAFIIMLLALPLLCLALSCIIGFLIQLITSRVRNKSFITAAMSLAFLAVYFYCYSQFNTYIQYIISNGESLANSARGILPIYWMGNAVASGNILNLLVSVLLCVVPFAAVYYVLSASFLRIATAHRGFSKRVYHAGKLTVSSPKSALLKRELSHFFASPMYMLNAGLGVIMLIIGVIFLAVRRDYIMSMLSAAGNITEYIPPLLPVAISLLLSMVLISAPSISLEGKSFWIIRSLPVSTDDVLIAKMNLHILFCLPASLFASAVCAFVFPSSPLMTLCVFAFPAIFCFFNAILGLIYNLLFPKFDWISETVAVKQSISSTLGMLSGWFILIPVVLPYVIWAYKYISAELYSCIVTAALLLITLLLFRLLMTTGKRIYERL